LELCDRTCEDGFATAFHSLPGFPRLVEEVYVSLPETLEGMRPF